MKNRSKIITSILFALGCLALPQRTQAVTPPADGCYPGFTTAEGCNALAFLGAGLGNTGVGWYSLYLAGDANYNTGVGVGTLLANTADENTATGAGALLSNTTGGTNTANGALALFSNTEGSFNVANGDSALFSNTTGTANIALGYNAGFHLTTGGNNIDIGNNGEAAESDTIRIGTGQTRTFIAGISGAMVYWHASCCKRETVNLAWRPPHNVSRTRSDQWTAPAKCCSHSGQSRSVTKKRSIWKVFHSLGWWPKRWRR